MTATNDDATPQTGKCSFTVTVTEIKTIGEVQGSVGAADNGLVHRSPFAPPTGNGTGQTVFVKGVVYEKTLARTAAGASQFGIFIQNTAAQADGDSVHLGRDLDLHGRVLGHPQRRQPASPPTCRRSATRSCSAAP